MDEQNASTRLITTRLKLLRAAIFIFNYRPYWPKNGETFCNKAVAAWARTWKFKSFAGLLANEMSDLIDKSRDWSSCDAPAACAAAFSCRLVVAHQQGLPSGHVAAVLPLFQILPTGKTWADVPVLSMGKTIGIGINASRVFKSVPMFSTWNPPDGPFPWGI